MPGAESEIRSRGRLCCVFQTRELLDGRVPSCCITVTIPQPAMPAGAPRHPWLPVAYAVLQNTQLLSAVQTQQPSKHTAAISSQHHVKYSTTLISPDEAWESAHPMPKIHKMLGNEQLSSSIPVHPGSCKPRDHQHLLAAPLKQPLFSNPRQSFSLLTAILSDSPFTHKDGCCGTGLEAEGKSLLKSFLRQHLIYRL